MKGWEETFGSDGKVYGIDCGRGFTAFPQLIKLYKLITYSLLYVKN